MSMKQTSQPLGHPGRVMAPDEHEPQVDYDDVVKKCDEIREPLRAGIEAIMLALSKSLIERGPLHGEILLDLSASAGVCTSVVLKAAYFLEERRVIRIFWNGQIDNFCWCDGCLCRAAWVYFPFDPAVDRDLVIADQAREQVFAQRATSQPARQLAQGEGMVYLLRSGPRYKIGITTNLNRRIEQLKAQAPFPLEVVHIATGKHYAQMESKLHRDHALLRVHGEWFEFSPDRVAAVIESMNEWATKGAM